MTEKPTVKADDIRRSLSALASTVDIARRRVADGDLVELRDLDSAIGEICGAISRLPSQERAPFKPPLVTLIDELDKLAATLKQQHSQIAESLRAQSTHQQAAHAYGNAPDGSKRR